jgi:glycerol-3-phosphate acyltransferase PlsX
MATLGALELLIPEINGNECLVLFGDREAILAGIDHSWVDQGKVDIVHSPEIIEMGEQPSKAFQKKVNSSITRGFEYLRRNLIDSFASA